MSAPASAPPPLHVIRSHSSAVSALFISGDNERIYSGDVSGLVVITSTRSLRSETSWKAHTDGLLGVEEWGKQVITHGRDNKLHLWKLPSQVPPTVRGSASAPGNAFTPELSYSLDVNALNFCRFSLLPLAAPPSSTSASTPSTDASALVAVPNLIESSLADIWALPSKERIHAAIGKGGLDDPAMLGSDGRGTKNPTGIIMSMHLFPAPPGGATKSADRALSLLISYENGGVKMWRYRNVEKERSIEGIGWECVWSLKLHVESVMATAVSLDRSIALSVSADHLVGKYDLGVESNSNVESAGMVYRTKHPGNGGVAFHDDGRICALGGWDGRVRLFSTKSFKALGTLIYHKAAVQALAFARARPVTARLHSRLHPHHQDHLGHHYHHPLPRDPANCGAGGGGGGGGSGVAPGMICSLRDVRDSGRSGNDEDDDGGDEDDHDDDHIADYHNQDDKIMPDDDEVAAVEEAEEEALECEEEGGEGDDEDDDDDEMSTEEKASRSRWLVSGAKDGRVVVWALMDFGTSERQQKEPAS